MKHNTLLVVAKRPEPGRTKTRLCPPLSNEQAADLYECFLRDTLEIMRRVPCDRRAIVYLPDDARDYFHALAPDMDLIQQKGESLGERLDNLLTEVLADGTATAVVMNSDSPTLPEAYISQAFEQLDVADVVLGPAVDGGYYLIGMKKPHPHLLRQVQMSTSHVLQDTLDLAAKNRVCVSLLPAWYDVDTVEELRRLRAEAVNWKGGAVSHTNRWLMRESW
jgi:rSAM/selenodomain-associated transferase 1